MKHHKNYKTFILFACAAVILLGLVVTIYAYLLEYKVANPDVTGQLPLAKDAAICFMLIGTSLMLQVLSIHFTIVYIARLFSLLTGIISLFALFQHCVPGYYTYLPIMAGNIYFGMSLQTALCFIILSIAVFFIMSESKKTLVQGCLHVVTCISFIVVVGYMVYIPHFFFLSFFSAMAVYTAVGLLLFSIAAAFVNSTIGFIGMVSGDSIGNIMARRLTIRIFLAVLSIGYFLILCYRHNWFALDFAIAVVTILFIIVTIIFIYNTSLVLNKIERNKEIATENFKSVIESAPNALIISDMKGHISLVNTQANKIFGYEGTELVGKELEIIIPDRFRHAHMAKQPDYFKNPVVRHFNTEQDLFALRKDGTEFPIEIGITPIITEDGTVALASIVDITELRHNESIIKNQISEIQIKSHEMEQFIYIASHDLQEPLRTLLNYFQLLEEDYPEEIKGEISEHLEEMKAAVSRMGILVRSLLDYGRLGQNKVLTLTNTAGIVKDVVADLATLIKTTDTIIEITTDLPTLYVYETELRQLFQNLINNAIKFRKSNITPVIQIGCTKKGKYYEFFVADNGIGIDPKHFQRIFLMFQRLHKEEEYKGFGVGLANCNKITDLHRGNIWVESELGQGSVFKFTILIMNDEQNS
jgi:PAS domain S-box-containing protein